MLRPFLCAASLLLINQSFAAQLVLDNNRLLGAHNIEINDTLYNVEFVDGVGRDFFGDDGLLFLDDLVAQPALFAQALLSQVFINEFDLRPDLTYGCATGVQHCLTFMPYQVYGDDQRYRSVGALNRNDLSGIPDSIFTSTSLWQSDDTSLFYDDINYAVWSLAGSNPSSPGANPEPDVNVTEPTSILLLSLGLAGFAARRRQKHK
ncbi:MAG: PEP-CTERM sorting domain-containing protein [Pseudomonadota bacterium]|nr:PEP-CTERM sorting domain-containing protein [Pseudomonadota bacterium]